MNTIFLIGGLIGLSSVLKPSVTVLDNAPDSTLKQLKKYLLEKFDQGQITTSSTLVFDVTSKTELEVIRFLETILPEAKRLFKDNWNKFQKSIVLLLPKQPTTELNNLLNINGLASFIRPDDVVDYLDVRGLVGYK